MAEDDLPTGATIEDYLLEDRTFPPPEDFKADALIRDAEIYDQANADPEGLLGATGGEDLLTCAREDWDYHLRLGPPLRHVVRRRPAQRVGELP